MNQFAYAVLLSRTSGLFRSAGRGRATLTRKSMPSRVLATVRSCMNGLFGSRLRSSRFICHKVSRQFSSTISLRQFRISSSTLTLFRPPRGLSSILPSRCISLLWILLSTGSLQEYPRQTGNLLHRPQRLSLSSGAALAVFCFLGAYPAQSFTNSISALAGWNTYCTGMK